MGGKYRVTPKNAPLKALGTIFEAAPIAAGSVVQSVLISSGDPD